MERIGRYEVVNRMGSGGFATVYRARDPHLDSEVAIKVLAENWTDNAEFKDRFMREAQLLRRIDSDHVVTVHDIGELPSGQPYFVMALADRGTLEDRLADRPPPTGNDAVAIAERMADCVATIHSNHLIHRDIKPSNLLIAATRRSVRQPVVAGILEADERLVLGDFGLAKDTALTGTGLTIAAGTGGYAAPEQMSPTGVPDQRTDVYAATAVIYRVVSGTRPPPFDVVSRTVPFVDNDWWMQGGLGAFFRQGMGFSQGERHNTVHDWFDHFERAVLDLTRSTAPGQAPRSLRDDATSRPSAASDPVTQGTAHWTPPPVSGPGGPDAGPSTPTPNPGFGDHSYGGSGTGHPGQVVSGPGQRFDQPSGRSGLSHPQALPRVPASNPSPSTWTPPPVSPAPSQLPHGYANHPAPSQPFQPVQSHRPANDQPGVGYGGVVASGHGQVARRAQPPGGRSRAGIGGLLALVLLGGAGYLYYAYGRPGLTIEGDDVITAGETARYELAAGETEGDDVELHWRIFDGEEVIADGFDIRGTVPGEIVLEVTAFVDGEAGETGTRTIEVEPSALGPTIQGPDEVQVDTTATFTYVETDTLTNPRWVDPVSGAETPSAAYGLTPTSPGSYDVILVVSGPDGTDIGARKTITITGSG